MEAEDLAKQLSENFTPDDVLMFGSQSRVNMDQNQMSAHSKDSLSFDGVCSFILLYNFHEFFGLLYGCCLCCRIFRAIHSRTK